MMILVYLFRVYLIICVNLFHSKKAVQDVIQQGKICILDVDTQVVLFLPSSFDFITSDFRLL